MSPKYDTLVQNKSSWPGYVNQHKWIEKLSGIDLTDIDSGQLLLHIILALIIFMCMYL